MVDVEKGEIILIIDEEETWVSYKVDGIWPEGASKSIDFSATQLKHHAISSSGERFLLSRGFKFKDYGEVWVKAYDKK